MVVTFYVDRKTSDRGGHILRRPKTSGHGGHIIRRTKQQMVRVVTLYVDLNKKW